MGECPFPYLDIARGKFMQKAVDSPQLSGYIRTLCTPARRPSSHYQSRFTIAITAKSGHAVDIPQSSGHYAPPVGVRRRPSNHSINTTKFPLVVRQSHPVNMFLQALLHWAIAAIYFSPAYGKLYTSPDKLTKTVYDYIVIGGENPMFETCFVAAE